MSQLTGAKAAIFAMLTEDPGVSAILEARVYPTRVPPGARLPYAVYNRITEETELYLDGPVDFTRERFQVDAWAATPAEAEKLKQTIKTALHGKSCVEAGGVYIELVQFESSRDVDDDARDGRELPVFGCSNDLIIWHKPI